MADQIQYRGQFLTPGIVVSGAVTLMMGSMLFMFPRPDSLLGAILGVAVALAFLVFSIRSSAAKRMMLTSDHMTYACLGLFPVTIKWKDVIAVHTFTSDEGEVGALGAIVLELRNYASFMASLSESQQRKLTPANYKGEGILIFVFGFNVSRNKLAQQMCQRAGLPGPIVG